MLILPTMSVGENNQATAEKSTVSGGSNNVAASYGAVVSGRWKCKERKEEFLSY
jgi:hypothetical protein